MRVQAIAIGRRRRQLQAEQRTAAFRQQPLDGVQLALLDHRNDEVTLTVDAAYKKLFGDGALFVRIVPGPQQAFAFAQIHLPIAGDVVDADLDELWVMGTVIVLDELRVLAPGVYLRVSIVNLMGYLVEAGFSRGLVHGDVDCVAEKRTILAGSSIILKRNKICEKMCNLRTTEVDARNCKM